MLPVPNLDDRRFQDLVDEARVHVRQRCRQWSDHNISDPGITLIETFAMMVEQLIYRLNRVPDLHYLKFLDLLGVELAQPGAAQGDVTFYLSAARPDTISVPSGTEVSTAQNEFDDPVVFTTTEALSIVPCSMKSGTIVTVPSERLGANPTERTNDPGGPGFECFSQTPVPGDGLWIGLANAVPSCAVRLDLECTVSGVGVNPDKPPYEWYAWTGNGGWTQCEVEEDSTGALNQSGSIVLHVPEGHVVDTPPPLTSTPRGWLMCRVAETREGRPRYELSPRIASVAAATVGGTAKIVHARTTYGEELGVSDGTPGQRFTLANKPVVFPGRDSVLRVGGDDDDWKGVRHFSDEAAASKSFHIDPSAGAITFGPLVRQLDGTMRQYGAIPPKGATLTMSLYRAGGGQQGNVDMTKINVLKSSVPYVSQVSNRHGTSGGRSPETIDEVKVRAPLLLHARDRAVTARDFEQLAREAAGEIARADCLTAAKGSWGRVELLVVPSVRIDESSFELRHPDDLALNPEIRRRVQDYLDKRRLVGTELIVRAPEHPGLTITAEVTALPHYDTAVVEQNVKRELYRLLHPLVGGPEGKGWPLGRAVRKAEVEARFPWVAGVDNSQAVKIELYPADWTSGRFIRRDEDVSELALERDELVFSYRHDVLVKRAP